MIIESLTIAQAQLVEKFPANSPGNVLMTDGMTKYGHHYSTYAVSTNVTLITQWGFATPFWVCTDYIRHKERNFGRLEHGTYSFSLVSIYQGY